MAKTGWNRHGARQPNSWKLPKRCCLVSKGRGSLGDLGRNRSPHPPVSAWQREASEATSIPWGVQVTAKAEEQEGRERRERVSAPAPVGAGCWPHSSPPPEMLQLCVLCRKRSPSSQHRAMPGAASL